MERGLTISEGLDASAYQRIFDSLPQAVLVVDPSGGLLTHNAAARELFGDFLEIEGLRCCDLVGCGQGGDDRPLAFHCISAAVLERGEALPELDASVGDRDFAVSAAPFGIGEGAVLHLREHPARDGDGTPAAPALRITTLGSTALDLDDAPLSAPWLDHRPGKLFKYLICARGHRVKTDELVNTLWPDTGRTGMTSLRQAVHTLRDRLEPGREKHAPSSFVAGGSGSYELDLTNVRVDADEFETEATAALLSIERDGPDTALPQLERAAMLYTGDFLPDEPYAEWALEERDRLRSLAARVLRELANVHDRAGDLGSTTATMQRLADLEPLDLEAQRDFIGMLARGGRHTEAKRRYELVRRRFMSAFEQEPDFALADVVGGRS
jgi:DNA-binding SARP family transcriptional activator